MALSVFFHFFGNCNSYNILIGLHVIEFCLQSLLVKTNWINFALGTCPILIITCNDYRPNWTPHSATELYHYLGCISLVKSKIGLLCEITWILFCERNKKSEKGSITD